MNRPLFLTADPTITADMLRFAAAAAVEPDHTDNLAVAASKWRAAPLVVLDGEFAVAAAADSRLERRAGVLVVVTGHTEDVWRAAVTLGAEHVAMLPDCEPWIVDRLAEAAAPAGKRAAVVAAIGARGGSGATSFAIAFAFAAARAGKRTMLVDADPIGGGIDVALGVETAVGLRWGAFVEQRPPASGDALVNTLPRCGDVTVLSWPRYRSAPVPEEHVEVVLASARRVADLVVVDVGRGLDETGRIALSVADLVYIVCPADVRACAAGRVVAETVDLYCADVRAVVRRPSPGGLTAEVVASALRLPLAGQLDEEPRIAEALDNGVPPGSRSGPLATLCDDLVAHLARPHQ